MRARAATPAGFRLSPFALVQELRAWFDGPIALSGAIASGRAILAAQALGADFAYIGSLFIATAEANAAEGYKQMIVDSSASDIVYSNLFTGVHGNYLRPSILAAGLDPEGDVSQMSLGSGGASKAKAWRDIWGCGQGIGAVDGVAPVEEVVGRLGREYAQAKASLDDVFTPQAFARRLEPMSRRLAENDYLAASRFTLADVSVAYALGFADFLGEAGSFPSAVIDYRAASLRVPPIGARMRSRQPPDPDQGRTYGRFADPSREIRLRSRAECAPKPENFALAEASAPAPTHGASGAASSTSASTCTPSRPARSCAPGSGAGSPATTPSGPTRRTAARPLTKPTEQPGRTSDWQRETDLNLS